MKVERIFFPTIQTEIEFRIGTSKEENDMVLTMGNPGDIWFHARKDSSCHVIAILSNADISLISKKEKRKILKKGAEFVKRNTAKLRSEKEVEMIYCDIQHVRKTEYVGCVLISNHEKTIRI
jgi:predicted ribosome quality control (RQC) complex YloA/Tae2 family protein